MATTDHVDYAARSARDDVLAIVKFADVFADVGATDAGVALDLRGLVCLRRGRSGWGGVGGTLRYSPRARMTDWIWVASSLVGERTRACVSR